jgi:hypothetical protein
MSSFFKFFQDRQQPWSSNALFHPKGAKIAWWWFGMTVTKKCNGVFTLYT